MPSLLGSVTTVAIPFVVESEVELFELDLGDYFDYIPMFYGAIFNNTDTVPFPTILD